MDQLDMMKNLIYLGNIILFKYLLDIRVVKHTQI